MNKFNKFLGTFAALVLFPATAYAQSLQKLGERLISITIDKLLPFAMPFKDHVVLSAGATVLTLTWMMFFQKPHGHNAEHHHADYLFRNIFGKFGGVMLAYILARLALPTVMWGASFVMGFIPFGMVGLLILLYLFRKEIPGYITSAAGKVKAFFIYLLKMAKAPFTSGGDHGHGDHGGHASELSPLHAFLGCLLWSGIVNGSWCSNDGTFYAPSVLSACLGLYTLYQLNQHGVQGLVADVRKHDGHGHWYCHALLPVIKDGKPVMNADGSPKTQKCNHKNPADEDQCQNKSCLTIRDKSAWDCPCGKKGIAGTRPACPDCHEARPPVAQPASAKSLRPGAPVTEEACANCAKLTPVQFKLCRHCKKPRTQAQAQATSAPASAATPAAPPPAATAPPVVKRKLPPPKRHRHI